MDWVESAAVYLSRASSYVHSTEYPSTEMLYPSPWDSGICLGEHPSLCESDVRLGLVSNAPPENETLSACNATLVTEIVVPECSQQQTRRSQPHGPVHLKRTLVFGVHDIPEELNVGKQLNTKEAKQVSVETEADDRDSQTVQNPNSPTSATGCQHEQSTTHSRIPGRSSEAKTDQAKEGGEQTVPAAKEDVVTDTTGECECTAASSPARQKCKLSSPRQSVLYHTCRYHQYFTLLLPV
eukprot:scpid94372/ scgid33263/ 